MIVEIPGVSFAVEVFVNQGHVRLNYVLDYPKDIYNLNHDTYHRSELFNLEFDLTISFERVLEICP